MRVRIIIWQHNILIEKEEILPNHITNQITFGTEPAALKAFQKMLRDVQMEGQPLGSFDFNKLLPMPKELNIESSSRTAQGLELVREYQNTLDSLRRRKPFLSPVYYAEILQKHEELHRKKRQDNPEIWALGEKAYSNLQRFGSSTWYEWCQQNWGTKWNAYQPCPLRENSDTMVFYTAWNSIPRLIEILSERYPEQTVSYRWADEDIGHNVGEFSMKAGKIIDINIPEGGSREAYEMSAAITGISLSDFGLYLTKDGRGYEYREPDNILSSTAQIKPSGKKRKEKECER